MKKLIVTGGVFNLLLGVFHLCFPLIFHWNQTLGCLGADQRPLVLALNYHLTLVIFGFGVLSIVAPEALFKERIGRMLSVLIGAFYVLRASEEWFLFDHSLPFALGFTVLCAGISVMYLLPLIRGER